MTKFCVRINYTLHRHTSTFETIVNTNTREQALWAAERLYRHNVCANSQAEIHNISINEVAPTPDNES